MISLIETILAPILNMPEDLRVRIMGANLVAANVEGTNREARSGQRK